MLASGFSRRPLDWLVVQETGSKAKLWQLQKGTPVEEVGVVEDEEPDESDDEVGRKASAFTASH